MSGFRVLYCLFLLRRQDGKKGHYHAQPEGVEEAARYQERNRKRTGSDLNLEI